MKALNLQLKTDNDVHKEPTAFNIHVDPGYRDTDHYRRPIPISIPRILYCLRTGYRFAFERYRQRKQLLEMDDRELQDIGITRQQAEWEACKPIWKC